MAPERSDLQSLRDEVVRLRELVDAVLGRIDALMAIPWYGRLTPRADGSYAFQGNRGNIILLRPPDEETAPQVTSTPMEYQPGQGLPREGAGTPGGTTGAEPGPADS